jgi:threonine efflux protein
VFTRLAEGNIMSSSVNLALILSAAFVASASPGPATLAIAETSMRQGRKVGLALAAGITTASAAGSRAPLRSPSARRA